jgi:hypothetical protein
MGDYMSTLTKAAIRASLVLKSMGGTTGSPINALMTFFEPILLDRNGHDFDPQAISSAVQSAYGWNFTADVAEGFRSAFLKKGWLKPRLSENGQTRYDDSGPVHYITYTNDEIGDLSLEQPINDAIDNIVKTFHDFYQKSGFDQADYDITEDSLIDRIIVWILDNRTDSDFRIGEDTEFAPVQSRLSDQDEFLIAKFVKFADDSNEALSSDLRRIASVGLLTEIANDFHKPHSSIKKTTLNVYLDSPVALDLIGTSGRHAAELTRKIVSKLQSIGASVCILNISLKEARQNIYSFLNKDPSLRYGPTQDAIQSGEIDEAFLHSILNDPSNAFKPYRVQLKTSAFEMGLRSDIYFSEYHYNTLFSEFHAYYNLRPESEFRCKHDATAAALTMRMRKGHEHPDVFQANAIFLTRNRYFSDRVRKFCIEHEFLDSSCVGPFVNMHELAASIWLRTGLNESSELPRRQLLVGCERVLTLKRSVVQQAHRAILSLKKRPDFGEEFARQVEAITTQDRSMLLISDHIRGSGKKFDDEALLEVYRKVLSDQDERGFARGVTAITAQRDRLSDDLQAERAAKVAAEAVADGAVIVAEAKVAKAESDLATQVQRRHDRLLDLLDQVNRDTKKRRVLIVVSLIALSIAIFVGSLWKEIFSVFGEGVDIGGITVSANKKALVLVAAVLGVTTLIDQLGRIMGFTRPVDHFLVERWSIDRFWRLAKDRDLEELAHGGLWGGITYADGKVSLVVKSHLPKDAPHASVVGIAEISGQHGD